MILSKEELRKYDIITDTSNLPSEIFAAQELQKYLKRIFKVKVPIRNANGDSNRKRIIIGPPSRNSACREIVPSTEDYEHLSHSDGFLIDTTKRDAIILSGSEDSETKGRGTLYAVYQFLEQLGCRFIGLAPEGEIVPSCPEVELSHLMRTYEPKLSLRGVINQLIVPGEKYSLFIDWMGKNRINYVLMHGHQWLDSGQDYVEEFRKRGIDLEVGLHSMGFWLPPMGNKLFSEHYMETNPQLYAQRKDVMQEAGKNEQRDIWYGQLIYCLSRPELPDIVAANISKFFGLFPYISTVSLWPNDGIADLCQCNLCRGHTKAELYQKYVNAVAEKLLLKFPDKKYDLIAYCDLLEPAKIKPTPNVKVCFANYNYRDYVRAYGTPYVSSSFDSVRKKWSSLGYPLFIYEYYMGTFGNRGELLPIAKSIYSDTQYYSEQNLLGAVTQIELQNFWTYALNMYTHARSCWNHTNGFEKLLKEFCEIFGEAKDEMFQFFSLLESRSPTQTLQSDLSFLDEDMKSEIEDIFNSAKTKASGKALEVVQLIYLAYKYSLLVHCLLTGTEDRKHSRKQEIETLRKKYGDRNVFIVNNGQFEWWADRMQEIISRV